MYTPALGGIVIDLKTLYAHGLGNIAKYGPREEHRSQVRGYATAFVRAGYRVSSVAWMYMDRSSGLLKVKVEPFDLDGQVATDNAVREIVRWALDPDGAPRGHRGPGITVECDSCPWLRRCWGRSARPGDPRVMAVHNDAELEDALEKFTEWRDKETAARKEKNYWSARVGRPALGSYGGVDVTYGVRSTRFSQEKAERLLEQLGVDPKLYRDEVDGSRIVRRNLSAGEGGGDVGGDGVLG
jgi:hypothetical protein